jgi:hypothetical protein
MAERVALDLVVLDALATLLPGYAETSAPKMLDCLLPLQALANPLRPDAAPPHPRT